MLSQKHIIITGASSGLGAALAVRYAASCVTLSLLGRDNERLRAVTEQCLALGATVDYFACDIQERERVAQYCVARDKIQPVDLLIANAGCSMTQTLQRGQTHDEAEHTLVDVHMHGVLNSVHPLIHVMTQRRCGQLAIMASLNGFVVIRGSRIYGAVKAALIHYGLALRAELKAQGVAVNVICPGWVRSRLTELNRFPMPGIIDASDAAAIIHKGLEENKAVIAFPKKTAFAARLFQCLPLCVQTFLSTQCLSTK